MKDKIIEILIEHDQTFVYTDSRGNNHPFQGINPNRYEDIATRIVKQLGEVEKVPDLSGLDKKNMDEFITEFIEMTAKNVLSIFVALGLETHIESKVVNDADGSEYSLSFIKLPPHPKEEPTAEERMSDEEKEDRETARRYIDSRITQMREQFIIDVFQEHSHHSIFDHNLMDEPGFKAAVKDLGLTDKQ